MILAAGAAFALLVVLLFWRRRRRQAHQLATTPLAGFDTGVRSPYRTPARHFHNRRTL